MKLTLYYGGRPPQRDVVETLHIEIGGILYELRPNGRGLFVKIETPISLPIGITCHAGNGFIIHPGKVPS